MKNILRPLALLSLTAVAIIGCAKAPVNQPEAPTNGDIIKLSAGTAVTTKVINQGGRTEAGFENGDNIGVSAFYAETADAPAPTFGAPTEEYTKDFVNIKATAVVPSPATQSTVSVTPVINDFTWPLTGEKFYPKASKYIFMYAYFPFGDTTPPARTTPAATTGVTFIKGEETSKRTFDKLEVVLKNETITDRATANVTQPDIMVARTATPVNKASVATATRLNFKHMLAQLRFRVAREAASDKKIFLNKLELHVPNKGTFTIDIPAADNTQFTLTQPTPASAYAAAEMSILSVDYSGGSEIELTVPGTEKAGYQEVVPNKPFMTFPFTIEDLKKCILKLELNFESSIGIDKELRVISLDAIAKPLKQGQLNTIDLLVSMTEISLSSTIEAWGTQGETIDIPIE